MELVLFGGLALVGIAVIIAAFAAIAFTVRAIVWLVLLPIKLLFGFLVGAILLPLGLVLLPVIVLVSIVGVLIAVVTVGAIVFVPLLPFVVVGLLVWLLVKAAGPAPA